MFATEIAASSASRIFTGGLMLGGAIDAMADNARLRRAEAASSVQELAIRLEEARSGELAAIELAAGLQAQLAEERAETARLRLQLSAEREGRATAQAAFQELYALCGHR